MKSRKAIFRNFISFSRHGAGDSRYVHRYFALLYFNTTRQWIAYAGTSASANFIYRLVERFHRIYEESLSDYIETGRCRRRHAHWRPYFEAVERLAASRRRRHLLAAVYMGARAHTRHDLRDAIVETCRIRYRLNMPVPTPETLREELLGHHSDRLFRTVFGDFCRQLGGTRPGQHAMLAALSLLWLRRFQRWRREAFAEALAILEEDGVLRASPDRPRPETERADRRYRYAGARPMA